MQPDFYDAHLRHLADAELLFNIQRWPNADHLYGLATECGLKSLMKFCGMPVKSTGKPLNTADAVHAPQIWARYESYRSRRLGAQYQIPPKNPFQNWNVAQRYAHSGYFNQNHVQAHRDGARIVNSLISQAILDGHTL